MKTERFLTSPQLEENDLIRSAFGTVLRRYRERAGYSQRSFSRAVGISNSHLRKIEAGETSPSLVTVYKLSAVLGQPVTDIIIEMDSNVRQNR